MSPKEMASFSLDPTDEIPPLLQFWRSLYRCLPRFPSTQFDISFTLATALVLISLRFFFEYVLIRLFDWPSYAHDGMALNFHTKLAASSMVAIFHSINLVPALVYCFFYPRTLPYGPSQRRQVAPLWWQDVVTALLQFCTGYMVYDGLLNIIWLKLYYTKAGILTGEDFMFLGHHLATTIYMSATRYLGAGHMSAMMCMLLGEATNPLHNAYYIFQTAQTLPCCNGTTSQAIFAAITFGFAVSYLLMRAIIGPVICTHMTYDLIRNGRTNGIPVGWIVTWVLLIWGVLIGSIPWIQDCWNMVVTHQYTLSMISASRSVATGNIEL